MRKGQEKILQRAEEHHFSHEYMEYLKREDLTIRTLDFAYWILYNYKDSKYQMSELKPLLSDKECQDYIYPILNALHHDKKPSPEDILFVIHDDEINNECLTANAILLLGAGWSTEDIHRIFTKYTDVLKRGAKDKFSKIFEQNTDEIDEGAVRFFDIITDAIYYDNDIGNPSLQEKYANISLTDERITSSIRFAIRKNIQPKEFERYEYNPMKYIIGQIPYLSVLSDNLNSGKSEDFLYEITNLEWLKKLSDIAENGHSISVSNNPVNVMKLHVSTESINIHLWNYYGARYFPHQKEWKWDYGTKGSEIELVVFYDGGVYEKTKKCIPLSIKRLNFIRNVFGLYGERVYEFIIKSCIQILNAPVLKDIDRLITATGTFLPPISVNECRNMHDMNQLFKTKWKEGHHINWNRTNANLGYAIIKSIPMVSEKDRAKLLEIKNPDIVPYAYIRKSRRSWDQTAGALLIANYIVTRVLDMEPQQKDKYVTMLKDYISMARELHQPIKIGFRSVKKIKDAHDKTTKAYNEKKNIHKVKVPKDSKFNELRKLLPKEFEWIKNGKRLYYEGVEMGHCVNSYYDLINRDICAIYSFVYDEKRYTAEFRRMKDGRYYTEQIQAKYDSGCPAKVQSFVYELIEKF